MKIINKCIFETFESVPFIEGSKLNAVLFHQTNCQAKFNAGLVKVIRQKYVEHCDDYFDQFYTDSYGPPLEELKQKCFGSYFETLIYKDSTDWDLYGFKSIVGLFGQFYYGRDKRYTNYAALTSAFLDYFKSSEDCYSEETVFLVPFKIGCGLGGGDWNIVKSLLTDIEDMFKIEFTVCNK
jgi:hypothetical protein